MIKISISMPSPGGTPTEKKLSIEEKVSFAVDCFYCNENSKKAYKFIEQVNNFIQKKKPGTLTARDKRILSMVKNIISMYGQATGALNYAHHMAEIEEPPSAY